MKDARYHIIAAITALERELGVDEAYPITINLLRLYQAMLVMEKQARERNSAQAQEVTAA